MRGARWGDTLELVRITVEPWMLHYRDKLSALVSGVPTVEMGGHVYGLCRECRKVVKLSGFWGGLHLCA